MSTKLDKNDEINLLTTLNTLCAQKSENEIVEFKEARGSFDLDKLGRYFSALSNEANLNDKQYAWLVFGVTDKEHKISGTDYKNSDNALEKLKHEIASQTTGGISFMDIVELYPCIDDLEKRVVMFKIPAAVSAIPTGWKNRYYGRDGESLGLLSQEEIDRIRGQKKRDWSKEIVPGATLEHLDKSAIRIARDNYKKRNNKPHIIAEIDAMSDADFLTKQKLLIEGKVTNAAMLLLGNSDFDHLMDYPPRIMWRLYDQRGMDKGYEIFSIPFIAVVDKVYAKIRNLTYRYMPNQLTLFPEETPQYDPWLLRELLNNAIVHQDYTIGGRVYVNEFDDKIKITNPGNFLPKQIEPVLVPSYAPPYYRNPLLAQAMVNFYMIDTASMGIRKVYRIQVEKFFPLPDYDFSKYNEVAVTVYGKTLNEAFTKILFANQDLDLETIFQLDRVQKNETVSKDELKHLRKLHLVEGKSNAPYLAAPIAEALNDHAQYIKNKGLNDDYYKQLIIEYLKKWKQARKSQMVELLEDKLPDAMTGDQKRNKICNLLAALRRAQIIVPDSDNKQTCSWVLVKRG